MTIPTLFDKEPERKGFWSAGKGEFEDAFRVLEHGIRRAKGNPPEFLDQMRTDEWFVNQIAKLIVNGGVTPSEEEVRAAATGVKLITQGQARKVFTWVTAYRSTFLSPINPTAVPYSSGLLKRHKDTHVLLPGMPNGMTLMQMEKLLPGGALAEDDEEYPYWINPAFQPPVRHNLFYTDETGSSGWMLMGIVPLQSARDVVPADMVQLIPKGQRIPLACELIYMTILWNYLMQIRLFPDFDIITSSKDGNNPQKLVGVTDVGGERRGWKRVYDGCAFPGPRLTTITVVEPDLPA